VNVKTIAGIVLPLVEGTFGKFSQDATLAKMGLDEIESGLQRLASMGHQLQLVLEGPNAPKTEADKISEALNVANSINTSLTLALSKLEVELFTSTDMLTQANESLAACTTELNTANAKIEASLKGAAGPPIGTSASSIPANEMTKDLP